MWTQYKVTWLFLTQLCGSVPEDPNIVRKWLEAREPKARPAGGKSIDEIQEEVFRTIATEDEEAPPTTLVFQRDDGGLVMRAATIKAHIKDCARQISSMYVGKIEREKSFAVRMINGVYTDERQYWIPILRPEGDRVLKADGRRDKAIHVRGMRGEAINALKTFEFVAPARMDFTLKVLGQVAPKPQRKQPAKPEDSEKVAVEFRPAVQLSDLETLFTYGGVHGYAGERGDGEGKYTFTIDEVK